MDNAGKDKLRNTKKYKMDNLCKKMSVSKMLQKCFCKHVSQFALRVIYHILKKQAYITWLLFELGFVSARLASGDCVLLHFGSDMFCCLLKDWTRNLRSDQGYVFY